MKAVIVEIRAAYAAALTDDGCVVKIKNRDYTIGETIDVAASPKIEIRKTAKWVSSVAAAVVLCAVSAWSYWSPYTYVSLDVNPSIEYSVNRFDRVIEAHAVNGDGEEIIKNINVTNARVDQAVKTTIGRMAEDGYLDEDFCGIVISTSCKNEQKAGQLAEQLQKSAEEEAQTKSSSVIVEAVSVDQQKMQEAKDMGVTPGKLNLVEKLKDSTDEEVAVEEWLSKPVKEIMEATQKNNEGKEQSSNSSDDTSEPTSEPTTEATTEPAGELAPSTDSSDGSSEDLTPPEQGELVDGPQNGESDLPPESSDPAVPPQGELGNSDPSEGTGDSNEGTQGGLITSDPEESDDTSHGGAIGIGGFPIESFPPVREEKPVDKSDASEDSTSAHTSSESKDGARD